jgi:hypothetical protein
MKKEGKIKKVTCNNSSIWLWWFLRKSSKRREIRRRNNQGPWTKCRTNHKYCYVFHRLFLPFNCFRFSSLPTSFSLNELNHFFFTMVLFPYFKLNSVYTFYFHIKHLILLTRCNKPKISFKTVISDYTSAAPITALGSFSVDLMCFYSSDS